MMQIEFPLIEKMMFLIRERKRYKVLYGGRGSGKSWGIARTLILLALSKKTRILCTRQFQSSISMSVHQLLRDSIIALGLSSYFKITRDSIICLNGSEFFFKGIQNNIDEIKSIEGIDICWVEEGQNVSKESWEVLCPTIRKENSEIWISFNPKLEADETYQRYIVHPSEDCQSVLVNYYDNPWFPEVLRREMEYCRRVSVSDYEYIWLGKPQINTEAQIFKGRYVIEEFEEPPENTRFFHGVDWGFAQDPTTLIRCFIKDDKLYIDREAYGVGVEIDETPQLFDLIPTARRFPIKADCSRPETISFIRRRGFNITAAKKWSGSVEDGLAILKGFAGIVIHPRCKHTADEFRLYSFKTDKKNGDILPIIEDKNNHCLVKGTLIETEKGSMPIEKIKIGDKVLTRKGYKRVIWSGISDYNRQTYIVKTDKGNFLCGTNNHKVLTLNGFCDIDTLSYGDKVLIKKGSQCQKVNVLNCMVAFGDAIRNLKGVLIENILKAVVNTYIILYGKNLKENAKKDMLSITKMEIVKTMIFRILRRLLIKNTSGTNILNPKKSEINTDKFLKNATISKNGIKAHTGLNGIKNMLINKILEFLICLRKNVIAVVKCLNLKRIMTDFVQTNAKVNLDEMQDLIKLLSCANGAVLNLEAINTARQDFVVGSVQTITCGKIETEVYDLTIEDCHEFFANGILVHNCIDAIRYALDGYIKGRGMMKINPNWEKEFIRSW